MKKSKRNNYVLDSYALLTYFQREIGAQKVRALLTKAKQKKASIFLSIINFGEVLYIVERRNGLESVQQFIAAIDQLPIQVVDAERQITFVAAHIKANHAMSYADAFAVATAMEKKGTIVTGDPEFQAVESQVSILWLSQ